MRKSILWIAVGTVGLMLVPLVAGCEGTGGKRHEVAAAQGKDQVLGCQKCYDETIRVRRAWSKGLRTQIKKQHACSDCKGNMETYTEGDQLMIKCSSCAPEGVACNRCLPPG